MPNSNKPDFLEQQKMIFSDDALRGTTLVCQAEFCHVAAGT
jgi:hypothetical protein